MEKDAPSPDAPSLALPPPETSDDVASPSASSVDAGGGGPAPTPFARAEPPPPIVVPEKPKRKRGRPSNEEKEREAAAAQLAAQGPTLALSPADAKPPAATTSAQQLRAIFVDSKRAATTITIAMDGALMALAKLRYGDAVDANAISDAERKELIDAWEAFLKATGTQLSPGAALLVAIGGVYGMRGVGLEMQRRMSASAGVA